MGIYDRDYYRREGPGYLDRLIPSGQVCKWLILANIAVFILQMITRDWDGAGVTGRLILNPELVMRGEVWRLISYAFLHDPGTLWHIFFNMLFLWWFGSDMESMYGPREFLAFYLCAALAGGIAFTGLGVLGNERTLCLGASGAITAVLVLYAFHFPNNKIYVFFVLPVPIWLFVVFNVAQDAFIFVGGIKSQTAVTVHLAGAAFGALYYKRHWHLLGLWDLVRSLKKRASRPPLRVYREDDAEGEPVSVSAPTHGHDLDEHLEAKLDAVLEKVARTGQGSLTESERQILLRASEIYKRKRS